MSWEDVEAGWGRHAAAFAYLIENLHWREYQHLLDQTGVASGTRYLDLACGSGLAVRLACERGAAPHWARACTTQGSVLQAGGAEVLQRAHSRGAGRNAFWNSYPLGAEPGDVMCAYALSCSAL